MDGPIDEPRGDAAPDEPRTGGASALAPPVDPITPPLAAPVESNVAGPAVSTFGEVVVHDARVVLRVAGQTLVLMIAEFVLMGLMAGVGLRVGNAGYERISELSEQGPLVLLAVGALFGPLFEELIFRLIPSKLSNFFGSARHSPLWGVGVFSAILFAAMHNLTAEPGHSAIALSDHMWLSLEILPITQFIAGLFFWHLMRKHGFLACFGAHAFHNSVLLSLLLVFPNVGR